ncbi:MAG: DUF4345 domain-containing protein [Pseudomonadales bacterium]|nr:DUF4345 domain-containing protein [Pseudomonadales bacterium]MDG1441587.1 DUF4345 domain-containing protein [Pseudomonadales bacterium]
MKFGKWLCLLGAGFFVIYGCLFTILPATFASLVTDGVPTTATALTDMRATYGGMSIAVGILLAMFAMRKETLRSGIVALCLLMTCMASTRVIGMVVDGEPNALMFIYLLLELVAMAICLRWLKVVKAE